MKTRRNVFLFSGDDPELLFIDTKRDGFIPVRYKDCAFTSNGKGEILRIVDLVNQVTYIPSPICRTIQY